MPPHAPHGRDALHTEHYRLHLGFRQDLNPGVHAVAPLPPLRRRRGDVLGGDQRAGRELPEARLHALRRDQLPEPPADLRPRRAAWAGSTTSILQKCGAEIRFYPGLPGFFEASKAWVADKPEYRKHDIRLEHYVVSTGLAQMIRGSAIAPHVDGIWGCEFIENPLQPGFLQQKELELSAEAEIAQIGMVIDNTTKTRALFEINKGTNKNPAIDVNSRIAAEDRRIPFQNMIYIADGPSDVPSFSVVKGNGGNAYGVYNPAKPEEYAQNDRLRQVGQDRPLRARRLHRVEQHDAVAAPADPRDLRPDRQGPGGRRGPEGRAAAAPPEPHAQGGGRPARARGRPSSPSSWSERRAARSARVRQLAPLEARRRGWRRARRSRPPPPGDSCQPTALIPPFHASAIR